jgi:hypothetical protein
MRRGTYDSIVCARSLLAHSGWPLFAEPSSRNVHAMSSRWQRHKPRLPRFANLWRLDMRACQCEPGQGSNG